MAKKKTGKKKSLQPPWETLLEGMRSQNRATIESVEANRLALEQRIDRLERDTLQRDSDLAMAIRDLRSTVQENSAKIDTHGAAIRDLQSDVRGLSARVESLARIEERVTALERRLA
jgi:uncharacterized protein YoxC